MAKRKRSTTKKSKPKRRIKPMATKRRRKRRSTAVRRTLSAAPRRRRRRSLADGISKQGLMKGVKTAGGGALGGALFTGTRMIEMPLWLRLLAGYGGAVAISMISSKAGNVSAGMAGATTYHLLDRMLPVGMLHDDMQDADYVDASTLSDSGYMDEDGNAILKDPEGVLYQLNDNNELDAIGDIYALNDGSIQGVSMYPLTDNPYALNDASPYALAAGY